MAFRAGLDRDRDEVAQMFDHVARRYDIVNDVLSLGQDRVWRRKLVEAVAPQRGMKILDLAAGTGTATQPLAQNGARVVAVDISIGMLVIGKARCPEVEFVNADAFRLPFPDGLFDVVTISFGLRNLDDTVAALAEMRRVSAPGGQLVVCEFSKPTVKAFRSVYRQYLTRALPALAKLSSSNPEAYEYLTESILAWPDQRGLADLIAHAGWSEVAWKNLSGGIVALHRAVNA